MFFSELPRHWTPHVSESPPWSSSHPSSPSLASLDYDIVITLQSYHRCGQSCFWCESSFPSELVARHLVQVCTCRARQMRHLVLCQFIAWPDPDPKAAPWEFIAELKIHVIVNVHFDDMKVVVVFVNYFEIYEMVCLMFLIFMYFLLL